ncbi:MAG TPA: NAD-dependent protein deacylase [Spirochaetota bacterium]|nr:NAD-dependent protein deacylase [Spirochaetota bacterium]
MHEIDEAVKKLGASRQTIALTGAGISTASGIPDFRGTHGLWKAYDPSMYAHINTFYEKPDMVWELALKLLEMAHGTEPNRAHHALAAMESAGLLHGIITQNIDNLHQRAGSRNVIDYHGTIEQASCITCRTTIMPAGYSVPVCSSCGRIMKPAFTLFGEAVPAAAFLEARNLASFADVFIVIGTSAVVQPAADLPFIAKENGACIIEMNSEETGLTNYITDFFIKGAVEETLPLLVSKMVK